MDQNGHINNNEIVFIIIYFIIRFIEFI